MIEKYHLNNHPEREITSRAEIEGILKNGKYTVISMCRENEPYIVTLSYGYDTGTGSLYFHSAPDGLKLDFIKANPNVCATVLEDGGYVENECEHNYRTVVLRGTMKILTDPDEKKHGMTILLGHLEKNADVVKTKLLKSDGFYSRMAVLKLEINHIQGKEGK
ncbi:MAG TPA: pyridoxamine 5'-phosphate oxidase family protein [Bacteroidales bacterium]|nr:pyridoxamine 5'-phosphate oxidase family protein [Bacteroidales bacterium]